MKRLGPLIFALVLARPLYAADAVALTDIQSALKQLTADSFAMREAAQRRIERLMSESYSAATGNRELLNRVYGMLDARGREALQLSAASTQPDSAKVSGLVEKNYALSAFVAEVMGLPKERREPLVNWALTDEGTRLVTLAYNQKVEQRVAAGKELANSKSPEALWLLIQMINAEDREVELAAIDAVWDKKPTPELVDALWNRAIFQTTQYNRATRQRLLTVRGRQISVYDQDYNSSYRIQDVDIVCDLLATWKDPTIENRLVEMLTDLSAKLAMTADYRLQQVLTGQGDSRGIGRLITAYKPKKGVGPLMKIVASPNLRDWSQISTGGKLYRTSSRISAGVMILQIAGEDPKSFGLVEAMTGRWGIESQQGSDAEENKFVEAMNKWWVEHAKAFGETPAAPTPPGQG